MTRKSRLLLPALLLLLALNVPLSPARALTYFSDGEAVVSGIITKVDKGTFTLDSGPSDFDFTLDSLNLEADITSILQPGTKVAVRGAIKDQARGNPSIAARKVLMLSPELSELAASELLIFENIRTSYSELD